STLKRLKMESDAGLITDDDEYIARLKSVTTRLKELEEEPYRRTEWRTTQLDETYAERWAKEGVEGRRKLLQDANAKLYLYRDGRLHLDIESRKGRRCYTHHMDLQRRLVRTSDPKLLARHLNMTLQEIADYALRVGQTEDLKKIENTLSSIWHQLHLAATQVYEHQGAAEEAQEFREPPEWDVAEGLTGDDASSKMPGTRVSQEEQEQTV